MGLKAAVRRQRIGGRVDLQSVQREDGTPYWIQPQKLDVATQDEIQAALLEAREIMNELPGVLSTDGEIASEAAARLAAKTDATQLAAVRRAYVLRIQRGIAAHNFDEDDGAPIDGVPEELVDSILALPELAAEVHQIVMNHNVPLARATAKN